MANNINHLTDAYRRLSRQPAQVVLATIIETFGSTYQKAGARMLIARDGEMTGLLGGGCFERDLVEQALSVFESGQAKTVFYDMRSPDDVIWGLGLGCNGAVRVFLQRLTADDGFSPLNKIAEAAEANTPGVLVTIVESEHPDFSAGNSLFLPTSAIDEPQPLSVPFPFTASVRQTQLLGKPRLDSQMVEGHHLKLFHDPIRPPLQLLVLGAGADAVPLLQCAKMLGWRVTLVDYRRAHLKTERFPQADRLLHLTPQELGQSLLLDRFDALILMTHNIEYDERYLRAVATTRIPFIGLLGPAARKERLLQSLGKDASAVADRVFGPVGLDIGAETPAEIALSIMAGIHAALNRRTGGQLAFKAFAGSHDPNHEYVDR